MPGEPKDAAEAARVKIAETILGKPKGLGIHTVTRTAEDVDTSHESVRRLARRLARRFGVLYR